MGNKTSRAAMIIAAAAAFGVMAGSGNAVAARLINSGDIKNNSIKSVDVKNGTLTRKDLNKTVNNKIDSAATVAQLRALATNLDARVKALEAQDSTGANKNFVANPGSTIVNATTVQLAQTTNGTSVEIANLDVAVQAGDTLSFVYELKNGAVYGAGAPRVFAEVNGVFVNTFDANPSDAGTPVAGSPGKFRKSVPFPSNGRVGQFAVVNDSGTPGQIIVSDVKVGDYTVLFK